MDEPTQPEVTVRLVEDPAGDERARRLHPLLATGIERWLRSRSTVDFGRDMSLHHDMDVGRRQW
jgi:hypothetical protein